MGSFNFSCKGKWIVALLSLSLSVWVWVWVSPPLPTTRPRKLQDVVAARALPLGNLNQVLLSP